MLYILKRKERNFYQGMNSTITIRRGIEIIVGKESTYGLFVNKMLVEGQLKRFKKKGLYYYFIMDNQYIQVNCITKSLYRKPIELLPSEVLDSSVLINRII